MKNIDLFNEYTAVILAQLYENFPVKKSIDVRPICGHFDIDQFGAPLDEMGRVSHSFEIAMGTVEWLSDNGYISAGQRMNNAWMNVVLTSKGLDLLRATPDSLASKEPFGDRISRFLKEGANKLAIEAVLAAFNYGASKLTPC